MAFMLSRRVLRALLTNSAVKPSGLSMPLCTKSLPSDGLTSSDSDDPETVGSDPTEPATHSPSSPSFVDLPLQDGLDIGIYKAILVGKVGQNPVQKKLKSGRTVTLLSVGTGGIRNNRRPFDNEEPKEYANRCAVQWHRVCIYPERLGDVAVKQITAGSILYVEGNLECKIFNDPISGLVRRIREVAIRRNGRLVFLGKGNDTEHTRQTGLKGVGFY